MAYAAGKMPDGLNKAAERGPPDAGGGIEKVKLFIRPEGTAGSRTVNDVTRLCS